MLAFWMHAYNAKYIPLPVTSRVIEVSFSYMVAYLRLCTAMLRHNKKFHMQEHEVGPKPIV